MRIESEFDQEQAWRDFHPYLARLLRIWMTGETRDDHLPLKFPDFKNLMSRALATLLFGLARKYGLRFGFFVDLHRYLGDDAAIIREAVLLINQARSVYQLVSERRWEHMDDKFFDEVASVLSPRALRTNGARYLPWGEDWRRSEAASLDR